MTFAEAIKKLREEEGLNKISMACKIGVSAVTVTEWEKGKYVPRFKRLQDIANIFDRSIIFSIHKKIIEVQINPLSGCRAVTDNETFETNIKWNMRVLEFYCYKHYTTNKDTVNDLVQETLCRAFDRYDTWNRKDALTTWLIGILKRVRSENLKHNKLVYVENYLELGVINDETESYFRSNPAVLKKLNRLSEKNKTVYKMHLMGYSNDEIGRKYGHNKDYTKTLLYMIKNGLKKRMIEKDTLCNSQ